jgi:hypothetical protein
MDDLDCSAGFDHEAAGQELGSWPGIRLGHALSWAC